MKTFTLNRTAALSIMALVFALMSTSCKKNQLKKDLDGTWTLVSAEYDNGDTFIDVSGTWTFDKKGETCFANTTFDGFGSFTELITYKFQVVDQNTILLDNDEYDIKTISDNNLTLSRPDGMTILNWNFNR